MISKVFKFKIIVPEIEVEADNKAEALKKAQDQLEHYSGSNDGSELLANGDLQYSGMYMCSHEKVESHTYDCSRSRDGKWVIFRVTYTFCKRCHKTLEEKEEVR